MVVCVVAVTATFPADMLLPGWRTTWSGCAQPPIPPRWMQNTHTGCRTTSWKPQEKLHAIMYFPNIHTILVTFQRNKNQSCLCCLMTLGLNMDIQCYVWTILFPILANHQIRHQASHREGCQPGNCRWSLYLPRGFVWVCMGWHTYFITPEGTRTRIRKQLTCTVT